MNQKQLIHFCKSMAMMLGSGISSAQAIELYQDQSLDSMKSSLELGLPLSQCMRELHIFPEYVLQMVGAGEYFGTLDTVFTMLSNYYERQLEIKQQVKQAVTYPLAMTFMLMVIVYLLLTQVVPVFANVFQQLGSSLDGVALMLLKVGLALSSHGKLLLILLLVGIVIYLYMIKKEQLSLPKKYTYQLAKQQWLSLMAMGLQCGLSQEEAMKQAQKVITNQQLKQQLETFDSSVPLSQLCRDHQLLHSMDLHMLEIAQKTGRTDQVLESIADTMNQENQAKLDHIIGMIEPTLVAILCTIVGIVLLSLMIPLISIMSNL